MFMMLGGKAYEALSGSPGNWHLFNGKQTLVIVYIIKYIYIYLFIERERE